MRDTGNIRQRHRDRSGGKAAAEAEKKQVSELRLHTAERTTRKPQGWD